MCVTDHLYKKKPIIEDELKLLTCQITCEIIVFFNNLAAVVALASSEPVNAVVFVSLTISIIFLSPK